MMNLTKWALASCFIAASLTTAMAKDTITVGQVLEPPGLDPTAGAAAPIRRPNVLHSLIATSGSTRHETIVETGCRWRP